MESGPSEEVTAIPVLIDITAPQNPYAVINHGAFMTNSAEVVVTISATDLDTGVGAYFISESPLTPVAGTPGWVDVTSAIKFGPRFRSFSRLEMGTKPFMCGSKISATMSPRRPARPFWSILLAICACRSGGSLDGVRHCCTAEVYRANVRAVRRSARGRCLSSTTATIVCRSSTTPGTSSFCGGVWLGQCEFSQSHRYCLRRQGRCLGGGYQ